MNDEYNDSLMKRIVQMYIDDLDQMTFDEFLENTNIQNSYDPLVPELQYYFNSDMEFDVIILDDNDPMFYFKNYRFSRKVLDYIIRYLEDQFTQELKYAGIYGDTLAIKEYVNGTRGYVVRQEIDNSIKIIQSHPNYVNAGEILKEILNASD